MRGPGSIYERCVTAELVQLVWQASESALGRQHQVRRERGWRRAWRVTSLAISSSMRQLTPLSGGRRLHIGMRRPVRCGSRSIRRGGRRGGVRGRGRRPHAGSGKSEGVCRRRDSHTESIQRPRPSLGRSEGLRRPIVQIGQWRRVGECLVRHVQRDTARFAHKRVW